MQDDVGTFGVDVFGVDEETVHVEDAGADRGEAGNKILVSMDGDWGNGTYSVFGDAIVGCGVTLR